MGGQPAQVRVAGLHFLILGWVRAACGPPSFPSLAFSARDPSTIGEEDVVFVTARDAAHALSQLHGTELSGSAPVSLAHLTTIFP